eukprot:TRINITY_DN32739_c0_g1_i1.p3 TRINITY_DN32739_c0_g1~~TRINITY_DN32739_c0_g1_i1.p3  ORF type:complete len:114 (-),score=10.86 TRINITY_DN32739_c0_g1_i1:102-443(-)
MQQKHEVKLSKSSMLHNQKNTNTIQLPQTKPQPKQLLTKNFLSPQTAQFTTIQLSPVSMFFRDRFKGGFLQCTEREFNPEKAKGQFDFNRFSKVNPITSNFVVRDEKVLRECE